ncbi:LEAF RUST 10 DISEASE-RESISTANCE LOCUS RECEPTOR-LIKE PROTEIN KINASE-like 2.4 isoform X2 [Syzygium oleosum]|uniref:LEAF RUST 10 DISEASE-RESISTANCE LOCUS RECEPTOR-LIKE PROTEIN KINASE-like 2.4 isoform X2 n=1 Tax=Syzygium oleosum TaxID=219896 RepID=UPI0024BB3BC4|nr:LEAF RUST 10 DISEASE-RESISTANCE LOCUS RECEPTOR-LIKE PROTEIN KINASE-like 2.4 isoform X2 [Syzygium oleosum]
MNTRLLLLLCAMFLVLMINMTQSQGNDALYSNCSNLFSCGNIQGVGYPFWGGNRSNGCGYPALQLACEDNAATIKISKVKYKVLGFYPEPKVLQIARDDFSSGICSPDFTNTTLDPALFSMVIGYVNSTIVYGCPNGQTTSPFSCTIRGTASKNGYVIPGVAVGPGSCYKSVVVPISQTLLPQLANNSTSLENLLQQGFEVRLGVDSAACKGCANTKGVCGYDISKNATACYCTDGSSGSATCASSAAGGPQGQPVSKGGALAIGVSVSAIAIIFLRKSKNEIFSWKVLLFKNEKDRNVEKLMRIHGSLVPRRYHYIDLKKMTNSFSEKLGQGGFGVVYKGKIGDGSLVAVKILTESKSSSDEFINEVVSISRTSHINVITLLGFCYEGNKRALIFEYMPNGSLDKFIPSGRTLNMSSSLEWKILYQIAIGIARGLEYLHRGCNTRILHFDIKPQNILLDQDFIPKISDFGLAKLCHGKDSAVSTLGMRGTVGFIAPEVVFRNLGRVSHKSDVYSYGMLVLEMVGFRNSDIKVSDSSDMYFPDWIYRNLEPGKDMKLPMNVTEEEEVLARKMIIVSMCCIQTSPSDRPPIVKVIEMLEGSVESLRMPPKPILCSPTLPPSQHWEVMASISNGSLEEGILENLEESSNTR